MSCPSVDARLLHRVPVADALALVDAKLGRPLEWPSPLIAYRLESDFQADWKAEVGQWLRAAEEFGFIDRVVHDVNSQARRPSRPVRSEKRILDPRGIDANDTRHLKLHQHLAAARVVHCLTATGWGFAGYETETGGAVDIDVVLTSPDGGEVELQVKAPDQPGRQPRSEKRIRHYRRQDGEYDVRITKALDKAAKQLRTPAHKPALIALCANREWPLTDEPECVVGHIIGRTTQYGSLVTLERAERGHFFSKAWTHVSGVVLLDLIRGIGTTEYGCTVFSNPRAMFPISPDWFPHGRVCVLDDEAFRWVRGEPTGAHALPEGTVLVSD